MFGPAKVSFPSLGKSQGTPVVLILYFLLETQPSISDIPPIA
jgi:hypothetical protein